MRRNSTDLKKIPWYIVFAYMYILWRSDFSNDAKVKLSKALPNLDLFTSKTYIFSPSEIVSKRNCRSDQMDWIVFPSQNFPSPPIVFVTQVFTQKIQIGCNSSPSREIPIIILPIVNILTHECSHSYIKHKLNLTSKVALYNQWKCRSSVFFFFTNFSSLSLLRFLSLLMEERKSLATAG